jgi:hypothetical protein
MGGLLASRLWILEPPELLYGGLKFLYELLDPEFPVRASDIRSMA